MKSRHQTLDFPSEKGVFYIRMNKSYNIITNHPKMYVYTNYKGYSIRF